MRSRRLSDEKSAQESSLHVSGEEEEEETEEKEEEEAPDNTNTRNHQPQVDNFVPLRARDVLEHSADFYDTSVNSGLSPFEVTRRLRKFGPNYVPGEKFDYRQMMKHAFLASSTRQPAG